MALTSNKAWFHRPINSGDTAAMPVAANARIYQGAILSAPAADTDAVAPLTAGEAFAGIALDDYQDNTGGAAGDKTVQSTLRGTLTKASVTGVLATTAPGTAVYASDDGTLTTTSGSNTQIGKVVRNHGAGKADVFFEVPSLRSV